MLLYKKKERAPARNNNWLRVKNHDDLFFAKSNFILNYPPLPSYIGRCYGVFEPGGHLLYKTTLRTAEMRAHTAGLTDALTLA